jgi:uncharacterized phage infection (PIP) family protein YhgE
MPDSLLFLLLVIVISLAFILLIGPELLQRLSGRNRRHHRQITQRLQVIDQSLQTAAARLRPFRDMQSVTHQRLYTAARNTLAQARDHRRAIRLNLEKLTLIQVPTAGWPAPFFIRRPQHFVTVPRDGWRLWRVGRYLDQIAKGLEQTAAQQASLDEVPARLREECRQLAGPQGLAAVVALLDTERQAGIANLTAWRRRFDSLAHEQAGLAQDLELDPDAPLEEVDDLAVRLERLQSSVGRLAEELRQANQERLAIDDLLLAVDDALTAQPGRLNPDTTPLVHRASSLLKQARQLRDQYELAGAAQRLHESQAMLKLADRWRHALPVLDELPRLRPEPAAAESRDSLVERRKHLAGRIQALAEADTIRLLDQPGALAQDALLRSDNPEAVSKAVAELHAQAEKLVQQHQSRLQELNRQANQASQQLQDAWHKLQQVRHLDKDPLTWRYNGLQQQYGASADDAQGLAAFVPAAREAVEQIDQARAELGRTIAATENLLQQIPALANQVREVAEIWDCFKRAFRTIDDLQAQAYRRWEEGTAAGNLEQFRKAAAEVGDLVNQAVSIADEAGQQADHLETLEAGLNETLAAVAEAGINLEDRRMTPSVRIMESYWQGARRAQTYPAAVDALNHASSYAEKLF